MKYLKTFEGFGHFDFDDSLYFEVNKIKIKNMTQTDLQTNLTNASLRDNSTFTITNIECDLIGNPQYITGFIGDSPTTWAPNGFRTGSGTDRSKDLIIKIPMPKK